MIQQHKTRYIDDLQTIYSEENRTLLVSTLPAYILDEYRADIEHIAHTYLDILYSASN